MSTDDTAAKLASLERRLEALEAHSRGRRRRRVPVAEPPDATGLDFVLRVGEQLGRDFQAMLEGGLPRTGEDDAHKP